jgi:ribulose-phosphate 3-epimerase
METHLTPIVVAPSLLACNLINLEDELEALAKIPNLWLHLDIMDGHFVPNLTFGHPVVEKISRASLHKTDAHLMVTNPEFYLNTFKNYNIHNITFHLETVVDPWDIARKAKKLYPSVGITIRPMTSVSLIPDEVLEIVDLVLVMSVEPGFAGQSFLENTYPKLLEVTQRKKSLRAQFQIQVDGGVTEQNASKLIQAGVTNLVAGSYIFKASADKYAGQIERLRTRRS